MLWEIMEHFPDKVHENILFYFLVEASLGLWNRNSCMSKVPNAPQCAPNGVHVVLFDHSPLFSQRVLGLPTETIKHVYSAMEHMEAVVLATEGYGGSVDELVVRSSQQKRIQAYQSFGTGW
jgi:hypothetical protein